MRRRIMILDAYNIIHRIPAWAPLMDQSLEAAREALLGYCRRWMLRRKDVWLFMVVFDGDSSVCGGQGAVAPGIRVEYSASGESADNRILRLLREFGERFDYTVVSDDRDVANRSSRMGASVITATDFGTMLGAAGTESGGLRHTGRHPSASRSRDEEDTLPPDQASDITESLRRLWAPG